MKEYKIIVQNKQRLEAEILEVKSRIEELKEEQKQKLERKQI